MIRARAAVSSWWSGVERHARLKGAVLLCLGVLFALVVAFVITVRTLAVQAEVGLGHVDEFSSAAAQSENVGVLLGTGMISTDEARTELVAALEALTRDMDVIDPDGTSDAAGELAELTRSVSEYVDASADTRTLLEGTMRDLAGRFEDLAVQLEVESRIQTTATLDHLDRVFTMMQIVAVSAAIIFLFVVATQILPLTRSIHRSMAKLREWNELAASESRRRTLSRQVIEGLDDAVDESAAYGVIARSLRLATPDHRAEMLLADSSQAHLRAAVVHPENGSPGCGVVSPWSCPAVRRGTTQRFSDSEAIRACPHLARRDEPCSAVCAPMTFMGEPMGVLHVTGPVGETATDELVTDISMLAAESATRVGTLRAFARAELQAATDVLTGLPNRRASEERLRTLLGTDHGGVAAVIEIVGLRAMNDEHGTPAGDIALKVAAEALSQAMRADDWCGRWAGAEFVAVLPGERATTAREVVARVEAHIRDMLAAADMPELRTVVGIADTRGARTAHGMMGLMGDALADARRDAGETPEETADADEKILSDPQLSTP
ncbi:MAG: GGDEF domain-containing protein [Acidimicrobiales bacterium]|nr:GGDEF domain-containing protein [Acidimicrobiales bacterium]